MRFWDASAIVPLCLEEAVSGIAQHLREEDRQFTVWWGTTVECWSSLARLKREGRISGEGEDEAHRALAGLAQMWVEIAPTEEVRSWAGRVLRVYALRASDGLQLAAALVATGARQGPNDGFVCFDDRLREAAHLEGFHVLPR